MASKHAVFGVTKTAAVEYGKYGIGVKAVSSGAARTEMLIEVLGSEEALKRMGAIYPVGRIAGRKKLPTRSYGCSPSGRRITPASR